ncbi:bcl-2-like protein 1 isoform X2 [Pleurodeles waltl]|uniref:bcl-2-like protein 1 isoform X2 n=1 Tax=Pleurodeles waltl TaxID=8319 RepID=UPI003709BEA6
MLEISVAGLDLALQRTLQENPGTEYFAQLSFLNNGPSDPTCGVNMSDGNRELVIDFLSHKLEQKGYSFSLCYASGHENGTQVPESGESGGRPNGSPSWESSAAQVMTDVSLPSTSTDTNDAVKMALRDAGDEFELRYCRAFSDLTSQLHITPDTAYQSFEQVVNELFRDGVNWGRIVAFFSFGGALSVESVDKEMEGLVANIVSWMSTYLSRNLDPWIQENGGWDTFVKMYGNDAAADARKSQERFGKWLLTGFTLAGALLLGSYLSRR